MLKTPALLTITLRVTQANLMSYITPILMGKKITFLQTTLVLENDANNTSYLTS